ncbi:COG2426 family protein [Dethiobacter alkaliphilus]|uniref:Putative small multi-drug export protein n=1 Tax=Dethiobacter alkaliphilus AHT 1 TaxID=555088 RepID=C0GGK3_DETAL|nr:small multi-drug export protein [Dethiobacter alkaliphilus]EEG77444.1 putative small multi-drug export protein [Dethiobacter alkaliphilus AHT 1]
MEYLQVFVLSAMPVVEIRGGVPLGVMLGLSGWEALAVSALGNVAIILPWLLILCHLETYFAQNRLTAPLYNRMVHKAEKKRASFVKYGKYALFLFVAIPLPVTGAWTACVASRVFRIPMKDTFWIVSLGVVMAGIIVLLNTMMVISVFS